MSPFPPGIDKADFDAWLHYAKKAITEEYEAKVRRRRPSRKAGEPLYLDAGDKAERPFDLDGVNGPVDLVTAMQHPRFGDGFIDDE